MKIKKIITSGGAFDFYFGKEATVKANPLHCRVIHSGDLLHANLEHDPSLGSYPERRKIYETDYSFSDLEQILSERVGRMAKDSANRIFEALKEEGYI